MMRLAERREDNLLCHLSLYGCLSYITPSLSLYLPAHLPLTHSLPPPLFFCLTIFPSHPLFIHFQSFSRSAKLSPSFSFTLISPLTHFFFPASSLRVPSLICLIWGFKFLLHSASSLVLCIFLSWTETDLMCEIHKESPRSVHITWSFWIWHINGSQIKSVSK